MTEPVVTSLVSEIRALLQMARATAARQVNALVVLTNYEIGRRIVLHEQGGEARAEYGKGVLQALSNALMAEFGRGFSVENLRLFRRFFLAFKIAHSNPRHWLGNSRAPSPPRFPRQCLGFFPSPQSSARSP